MPHIITLNTAEIAILKRVWSLRQVDGDLLFPGVKGNALSDMTLSKILREAEMPYTLHGFRSSFRDWAAENMPHIPDPVAEVALAHSVPQKVLASYKRTQFIEMRESLLEGWAVHCTVSNTLSDYRDPWPRRFCLAIAIGSLRIELDQADTGLQARTLFTRTETIEPAEMLCTGFAGLPTAIVDKCEERARPADHKATRR